MVDPPDLVIAISPSSTISLVSPHEWDRPPHQTIICQFSQFLRIGKIREIMAIMRSCDSIINGEKIRDPDYLIGFKTLF